MKQMVSCAAAVLLLAGACSAEAPVPANDHGSTAPAAPRAAEAASAEPGPPAPAAGIAARTKAAAVRPAPTTARRCGWLHNPTPGNWWLIDRHGEWILATQGGESPAGMDDMPDMSGAGWVETNGHYGHGCACMTVTADPAGPRVVRISSIEPKPLKQCRNDPALPKP
jgi:hypothetical protein